MTTEMITLVIDATRITPTGGQTARIVGYDIHGHEVAWFGIDTADDEYAPTSEHPDRAFFGWAEDHPWSHAIYNNVDEAWAAPSWEAAVEAALYEHADRIDAGWYADNAPCRECATA